MDDKFTRNLERYFFDSFGFDDEFKNLIEGVKGGRVRHPRRLKLLQNLKKFLK
jgi:hypothetical protein